MRQLKRCHKAGVQSTLLFAIASAGCQTEPVPHREIVVAPETLFEFDDLALEERNGKNLFWQATARTAAGDTHRTVVQEVTVHYFTGTTEEKSFQIDAPTGTLDLDTGNAEFENAIGFDAPSTTAHMGDVRYVKDQKALYAEGPLRVHSLSMEMTATTGVYHTESKLMELSGPVNGRLWPKSTQAKDSESTTPTSSTSTPRSRKR